MKKRSSSKRTTKTVGDVSKLTKRVSPRHAPPQHRPQQHSLTTEKNNSKPNKGVGQKLLGDGNAGPSPTTTTTTTTVGATRTIRSREVEEIIGHLGQSYSQNPSNSRQVEADKSEEIKFLAGPSLIHRVEDTEVSARNSGELGSGAGTGRGNVTNNTGNGSRSGPGRDREGTGGFGRERFLESEGESFVIFPLPS